MVTDQIMLTPGGAAMLVSARGEDRVGCPHCGESIMLEAIEAEPGCLAVACPHCEQKSLLVRLVSVLHRAVRWPGELLSQLQGGDARARSGAVVRMPAEVFALPVSRGAVALLAMLWHRAERTGSMLVESSLTQMAQRQLSSRGTVRRQMIELVQAKAVRERLKNGKRTRPRRWELLPLTGEEVSDG